MTNNITIPEQSLVDLLQDSVAANADHVAVAAMDGPMNFAEFGRQSDAVAAALVAQGIEKGDRIGLYCINSSQYAVAWAGIIKAGAAVVPVNLLINPNEVQYILNDAGVRAVIYYEAFAPVVDGIRDTLHTLEFCVRIGQAGEGSDFDWAHFAGFAGAPPEIEFDAVNDVASIIYTSGTTGKPKGAMLTHRNLAFDALAAAEALTVEAGKDILLVVLPMFHSFAATVGMLVPLLSGCTIVPVPKFDPDLVTSTIEQSGATLFLGVPSMYAVMTRLPGEHTARLKSLRFGVSGGAAMPVEVMKQFEARYGVLIYEGDGPTECGPVTCVNPIGGKRKPGSVGLPIPGVDMAILDDAGEPLPHNEVGEICVRGPNVMAGYWNLPEATAESFTGEWFRTGDLGTEDDEGYFCIVDRKKDMIIVNGMNVYPRMVEEVLYRFEPVAEAAVVGEPSELHGETVVAYLALKEGSEADTSAVKSFCRENLGRHQVPRKVVFVDELPKNATGKILKRELRRQGEVERGIDIDAPA